MHVLPDRPPAGPSTTILQSRKRRQQQYRLSRYHTTMIVPQQTVTRAAHTESVNAQRTSHKKQVTLSTLSKPSNTFGVGAP